MKIETIIEDLLSHHINKSEAINRLKEITNGLRNKNSIEMEVESIGFSVGNNHGFINLKKPYGYSKIEGLINKGDKVDINLIP